MRLLYSLAWWLALPLALARLWWRGRREPGYRRHVAERLGFYGGAAGPAGKTIWIHAVSVGETRASQPLVEALLAAHPDCSILLTHMTPTGRATGAALFAPHADRLRQCYLPYDTGWMVGRFLRRFRPRLCVLMETEVWPNLMAQCERHGVPVALVNARLSQRSLAKAERLRSLMLPAARAVACVAAQTEADAARIATLGVRNVTVTGSIKFDAAPPQDALRKGERWRAQWGGRPVLLCASTREGEEDMILDALQRAPQPALPPAALLVIVPRHPQRFDEVAARVAARGMRLQRRSLLGEAPLAADAQVLLGDSMGEMFAYYAACDLAFIGGSLLPLGGQNLIEACAVGKPVLIGPHTFNFAAISEDAVAAGAALRAPDADAVVCEAARLLHDEATLRTMGTKALAFAQRHRGATARTLALIEPLIERR